MDNLGPIVGPTLAQLLVAAFGTRPAIGLSVIPGLLAAGAIVYAIRHAPRAVPGERQALRIRVRPLLDASLGPLLGGIAAFEVANVATTLLILRARELLGPGRSDDRGTQLELGLYIAYCDDGPVAIAVQV